MRGKVLGVVALIGLGVPSGADDTLHTRADLLAEDAWIQPGRPFWLMVRLRMNEGWHTYWKNPGDSGLPTRVRWRLPEGFHAGPLEWPAPERFEIPPLANFGYKDEVGLLAKISPPPSIKEGRATIGAHVEWIECADACVPGKADLFLTLPVRSGPPARSEMSPIFDEARRRLPLEGIDWSLRAESRGEKIRLSIEPAGQPLHLARLTFFPEDRGVVEPAAEQKLSRTKEGHRLDLFTVSEATAFPASLRGVLVAEELEPRLQRAVAVDVPLSIGSAHERTIRWFGFGFLGAAALSAAWAWKRSARKSRKKETI